MKIRTRFFGEVEISEEDILVFQDGILGFEESRKFILLDVPENDSFRVLQDIERELVSFVVADPWSFEPGYDIDIPDEELLKANIRKKEQLRVLSIVTLSGEFTQSTFNLLAPLVLNMDSRLGRQIVLNSGTYTTRHPLFPKGKGVANADPQ
jgi:flagellar assembly factor FliW